MDSSSPSPRRAPPADAASVDRLVASASRLAAVDKSALLDSPSEEAFDALTQLAARVVNVPASFVSVVAADRDFYISQTGFDKPLSDERQILGRTFCHYTLGSDAALVIDDTHADPVWKSVPTVTTLGVRAYVGVPIQLDGQNIGSFCVIDVKPRVWQPDELETIRQLALSAAREISLRSALEAAQAEVASARAHSRSREEVLAVVAHDLKTPLQVLTLSMLMLQRTTDGEHAALAGRMSRAVETIKEMADELLSSNALLAPSDTGRRDMNSLTLLWDSVDMMRPIATRAGIALELGEVADGTVHVDYGQMLRVMGNLIGNAVKYSAEGSEVIVSGQVRGDQYVLSVKDNGKGIAEADQPRVFDSGWQGGDGRVRGDGAGLGLSIVKKLVAEHGGVIELTSAVDLGTTVHVLLPLKA